jgi:hypothetical protein
MQLAKRTAAKEKATKDLEAAKEAGDVEDIDRCIRRPRRQAEWLRDALKTTGARAAARTQEPPSQRAPDDPCSIRRFAKRTVKMDKTHIADCKKLLTLMGMPV